MELTGIYREMVESWNKPIVLRDDKELDSFSFGILKSRRYLANLDCAGQGPESKSHNGGKVYYLAEDLAEWLQAKNENNKPVTYKAAGPDGNYTLEVYADCIYIGQDGAKLKKVNINDDLEDSLLSSDGIEEIFERYCGPVSFIYQDADGTHIVSCTAGADL